MNDLKLYEENTVSIIPQSANTIDEILKHNVSLTHDEVEQIIGSYNNHYYMMTATFVWNKTIVKLRNNLLDFGEDFICEMLDRQHDVSINSISNNEIINLSSDLGFINRIAKIEFLHYCELIQHYMSEGCSNSFPETTLNDLLRTCIENVLGQEKVEFIGFSEYRKRLKTEYIKKDDSMYNQIVNAQYIYKKTTYKTLLNLSSMANESVSERDIALNNLIQILQGIWDSITSEDKWKIGRTYASSILNGDKKMVDALKIVLLKVKGFDYVPESLRSESYISAAHNLLDAHNGINNFYNEPEKARVLLQMGNSIPSPAFGVCIVAILACKLGNSFGISWDAQNYLDEMLKNVSNLRWEYFLDKILPNSTTILFKLSNSNDIVKRWIEIAKEYRFFEIDKISDLGVKDLLKYTKNDDIINVQNKAKVMLDKI